MAQDFVVVSHVADVKAALKNQLASAAEIIRGMMESNAKKHISEEVYDTPPSWYARTGLLRNSITTEVTEDKGDTCVVVGTNVDSEDHLGNFPVRFQNQFHEFTD